MAQQKTNTRNTVLILMIAGAIIIRFVTYYLSSFVTYSNSSVNNIVHWSNFTPLGAIALFGGTYFNDKWKGYLVPLFSLLISDIVINYMYSSRLTIDFFSLLSLFRYLCIALTVFMGTRIKNVSFLNVGAASILSVIVFWLLTDLPFLYPGIYPNTLVGYGQSLMAALPFQKNMLLGDAFFGVLLFGSFELAKNKYTILRSATTHSLAV